MNYDYPKFLLKFLPLAAIGTISHEFGHFLAGLFQGHLSWIAYDSTHLIQPFMYEIQYIIFIIGGPLITWLTCLIGLTFLIFKYRKRLAEESYRMSSGHQISLFATLFCSRAVFNSTLWTINKYIFLTVKGTSDEEKISQFLGWPPEILIFGGLIVGLVIIFTCLFLFIPKLQRLPILICGLIGALLGYVIWYYLLGPVIMRHPPW